MPGSKPFKWLVKWVGYDLDRDAKWSYVKRSDFTTEGGMDMLKAFERERNAKSKPQSSNKARKRPASAPPRSPPTKHGRGGRGRGRAPSRGGAASSRVTRSRNQGLFTAHDFFDGSDEDQMAVEDGEDEELASFEGDEEGGEEDEV